MDSYLQENQAEETWNFLDGTNGTLKSEESKGLSEDTLYLRARVQNNLKEFNKTIKGLQDCLKGQGHIEQEPIRKQERIIRVEHILQERKDKKLLAKELIGEHIRKTTGGTHITTNTFGRTNSNPQTLLRDRSNINIAEIPYQQTQPESKENQQQFEGMFMNTDVIKHEQKEYVHEILMVERDNQFDQRRSYPGIQQTTTLNLSGSVIEEESSQRNIVDQEIPQQFREQYQQQEQHDEIYVGECKEYKVYQQFEQQQGNKLTDDNTMQEKLKELIQLEELNDKGRFTFCPRSTKEHPHPHWIASRYINTGDGRKNSKDFNSLQSSQNGVEEEQKESKEEEEEEEEEEEGQIDEICSQINDQSKEDQVGQQQHQDQFIILENEKNSNNEQTNLNFNTKEIVVDNNNNRIVKDIKDSGKKQTNSRTISNGCLMDELAALKKSEKIVLSSNRITSLKQSAQLRQSKVFAFNSHDTLILNRTQITPLQQRDNSSNGKQKGRKNTIDVVALIQAFKSEKETKNIVLGEEQQSKQSKSNSRTSNIQMNQNKLNSTLNKSNISSKPVAEITTYQRLLSKSKSSCNVTWNNKTSIANKTPKNKYILVNSSNPADKSDLTEKYTSNNNNNNITSSNNSNVTTTRKSNTPNASGIKHSIIQTNSNSSINHHRNNLNNQNLSGFSNNNHSQSSNVSSFLASNYASENPNEQQHKPSCIIMHDQQQMIGHQNHFTLDLSYISNSASAIIGNNNNNNEYNSVKDTNNKGKCNPSSRPPPSFSSGISSNQQSKCFETQLQTHYISPKIFSDGVISSQNTSNSINNSKLQQQQPLINERNLNSLGKQNIIQGNNVQQSCVQPIKNIANKNSSNNSSAQKNSSKGSQKSQMGNVQNNITIENKNFFEKTSPIIQQIKNERENAPPASYVHEFQKKKQLQRQNSYNNSSSYLQIQQIPGKQ